MPSKPAIFHLSPRPLVRLRSPAIGWIPGIDATFILVVLALAIPVRLYEVSIHPLPFGFAGLYTLMAESISSHHYALPERLPFYGPGGVPFAYPPLALYVMAAAHDLFGVSSFTYLRFAPLIFTSLYIVPLYGLYKMLAGSPVKAFLATTLALTSPDILVYHEFADGAVRGFAFLCMSVALLFTLRALRNGMRVDIGVAGVLFGATVASHPANALFLTMTVALLMPAGVRTRRAWTTGALIVGIGLAVSAIWWVTIVERYGLQVFLHALGSHGTSSSGAAGPGNFLPGIADRFWPVGVVWYPEYLLALFGCVVCIRKRQWFLPVWLAITVLFMPDYARFVGTIVALLAAITLVDLARATWAMKPSGWRLIMVSSYVAGSALLASLLLAGFFYWAIRVNTLLSPADMQTATWVRSHTPTTSTFAVVTTRRELAEWYPYLLRRNPVIAEWGAEWTGNAGTQHALFDSLATCARRQSLTCVDRELSTTATWPAYLLMPRSGSLARLAQELKGSSSWSLAYRKSSEIVWRRR